MKIRRSLSVALSCALLASGFTPPPVEIEAANNPVSITKDADSITVENDFIKRQYSINNGQISTTLVENKRANTQLEPQAGSEDFVINTISNSEDPDAPTDTPIENPPKFEYSPEALPRDGWSAELANSAGDKFPDAEVNKLFDGDLGTHVDQYTISGHPITLTVDLGKETTIQAMSVNKRPGFQDAAFGINGTMGGYTIKTSTDGNDWTEVKSGEFSKEDYNLHQEGELHNVGDMVFTNLDQPITTRYIQVIQTSTAFGTAQEFTSSELNFYDSPVEKKQVFVPPTQVIDRTNWNVSITNASDVALSDAEVKKLTDGNLNTEVNDYAKSGNPFTVDIDLGSVQKISSLSIDKRPGYSDAQYGTNGTMGEFELYVSSNGTKWELAGAGEFTKEAYNLHEADGLFNVGDRVYANFYKTYETQYVRLVQKSCSMGSSEEFTSAELNLYSDPYQGPNWNHEINPPKPNSALLSSKLTYKDSVIEDTEGGKKLTIQYEPYTLFGVTYNISQVVVLQASEHYMRSFIEVMADDKDAAQIDYIDTDYFVLPSDAQGVWGHPADADISSMWIGKHELMLGQPVYANGFFMGSEFPAADTIIEDNATRIRYYSGKTFTKLEQDGQLTTDGKFVSWQNVLGAAKGTDTSVVQTDFFEYIENIATPTEFRKQYNSWYDNMMSITDESIADSFYGSEAGLTSNGVEPLDSYVVDDGWNNYNDPTFTGIAGGAAGNTYNQTGFWEFNSKFPNELYTSSALSDKFQSTFGLWVGPQGGYNYFNTFAQYLESVGTGFVQSNSALGKVVCTGSRKYLKNFAARFIDYQTRFNIDYWKWDGFASRPCNNAEHDHMTGGTDNMYFTSDMWEAWIDVFEAAREARSQEGKGLFINATCYVNLSPWLLQWVNTVWVQDSGDTGEFDKPTDIGARHQRKIYYRDQVYYQLYKQNQVQFPLKNIYNHDPIYGVSDESDATTEVFRQFLFANAVRGTAFWELYYSPSIMNDEKWKVTADVLEWAEKNHHILKNAKLIGDKPGEGVNGPATGVYGYSCWNGTEGVIAFTNPLNTKQAYSIKVNDVIGADPALSNATGIQVFPYAEGLLADKLSYNDIFGAILEPNETKVFQFGESDDSAPSLISAKVTGAKEVTLKFSERVQDDNVYTINNAAAESAELLDDYRTVILSAGADFTANSDVAVQINDVKDVYGNTFNDSITLTAYTDGLIAKATQKSDIKTADSEGIKDLTNNVSQKNFMQFEGEKEIDSANALTGTNDFALRMALKTTSANTTLFKQGEHITLRIDADGYLVFQVGSQNVTSKEVVTTVEELANGTFGTDAYKPTTTKETIVGKVNDNNFHTVSAVREANGMLKIYLDGELKDSAYDASVRDTISAGTLTIGGQGFSGYLSDVQLLNSADSYQDAKDYFYSYRFNSTDELLDRTGWTASACSETDGTTGDSYASAAIDGKENTHWHTNYYGEDKCKVDEHWIQIDFGEGDKTETFDNFIYVSRGPSSNGSIKDFILEAEIDGTWTVIKEGTFSSEIRSTVALDTPVTATGIRLNSVSTHNGQNFASAVEIYVSKNTDANATQEQIQALKDAANQTLSADDFAKNSLDAFYAICQEIAAEISNLDPLNVTISQVAALQQKIDTAKEALVSIKGLRELINTEVEDEQNYSTGSWSTYKTALDNANVELKNDAATAEKVSEVQTALKEAIDALVNIKGLKDAIATPVEDKDAYTSESWDAYEKALKAAQDELAKPDATKEKVNEVETELKKAIDGLVKKTAKDFLIAAIVEAEAIMNKNYTEESWNALQEAISHAKDILNSDSTDEVMNEAIQNLSKAIDELVVQSPRDTLTALVADAKAIENDGYTDASWDALQNAITAAQILLDNSDATDEDLTNAVTALKEAIDNLVKDTESSRDVLTKLVADAKAIENDGYTDASWDALQNAITAAQTLLDNPDATDEDLTKAVTSLNEAINNLVKDTDSSRDDLVKAVEEAKAIKNDNYTAASWNALQQAIKNAQALLQNSQATNEELTKALTTLNEAVNALTKPSKDTLIRTINSAKSIKNENYTKESWNALQSAVKEAEAVFNDVSATEKAIQDAVSKLEGAIKNLKKQEEKPDKPNDKPDDTPDPNTPVNTEGEWKLSENGWWFDKEDGGYCQNEWAYVNNQWYLFNDNGYMETGWANVNGSWYYLNESGAMATGWAVVNDNWYYLNESGAMATGWAIVNDNWYYLDESGAMETDWVQVNNNWYYLDSSGAMATGWILDSGTWYYTNESGAMQFGWINTNGAWYYLDNSGVMLTGWINTNGTWYYCGADGAMQTGWILVGSTWYYCDSSGAMQTGWLLWNGSWYYLDKTGNMVTGTRRINGVRYTFDSNGVMQ